MHILICSFHFDHFPEGICTGRMVRALLEEGCRVTLVTSQYADTSFEHPRFKSIVVQAPPLPRLAMALLTRLYRTPGSHPFWCRRVAALAPQLGEPALVYGRSAPIPSVHGAWLLAARLGRPLWNHFSDPFPTPWVEPGSHLFHRLARYARRVLRASQVLTFSTAEGLAYQEKSVGVALAQKAFVLEHVAPAPACLPVRPGPPTTFAYIGSFYGQRNANALLEGFALHLKSHPGSRFVFVGTDPAGVMPEAQRLGIASAITMVAPVKDVRPQMAAADALVALDAERGEPVFLTTKLVEYLMVNRPVLLLSPDRSPGAKLVRRFGATARLVAYQEPKAICEGLDQVLALTPDAEAYASRFQGMGDFSPHAVATRFLEEAARRGIR